MAPCAASIVETGNIYSSLLAGPH